MKFFNIILLTLLFVLIVEAGYGQNVDSFSKEMKCIICTTDSLEKKINSLKKEVDFNENRKLTKVVIDNTEDFLSNATDNGGSLTGYFEGDSLVTIEEWVGLSNRVVLNNYYLEKGKLVFTVKRDNHYEYIDSTKSFNYTMLNPLSAIEYYFVNEKLLVVVADGHTLNSEKKEVDEYLLASLNKYKFLLTKRKKELMIKNTNIKP